eukprot:CAMPEP_0197033018 /NCGR_PEP_ID=MMETSP1384-20130603/11540_1 /TAXON_ID=29189 /ORGANISM="Ammonia sp." /LENGTH=175 /DNA_ID=CAMNT_0042462759 /DNA_START=21 /DNA_END=545 /DNA_ORIENTATION=+
MCNKLLLVVFALIFASVSASYKVPCLYGETNYPVGCEQRILPCDQVSSSGATVVSAESNSACYDNSPRLRDTVAYGESSSNLYYVEIDDKDGNCYAVRMYGGEDWGSNARNNGGYNCMGRCGPNCGSWACSNWGRDCMKHDVCSYFFSATGNTNDDNCGDEWDDAQNDWGTCCVW